VVGSTLLSSNGIVPDHTWLFGSTAGVWGQAGAAHYSAANCFLDGLAHKMQALGQSATAVQFGPYADVGMAASVR
jgi:hypothetical protein